MKVGVLQQTTDKIRILNQDIDADSLLFLLQSIFPNTQDQSIVTSSFNYLSSCAVTSVSEFCSVLNSHLLEKLSTAASADKISIIESLKRLKRFESEYAEVLHSKPVSWPVPVQPFEESSRALAADLPFARRYPLINKQTPIGAGGSCFATEISHYLKRNDYNFIVTEPNEDSCAAWGGLYNTPSFRQLIEFSFGLRKRPNMLFECEDTGKLEYWDPFREGVFFKSISEYEQNTKRHIAAAKEALSKVKVFVMTVGLNEIWRLNFDNSVLARYPRSMASHLVHNQVLTVEENVSELQQMLDVWRRFNPDLKIIITVSPVPLHATFRADECHVITSTCHSKAVLRLAVEQFVRQNPGTAFYFPAFEVVSYCAPKPWEEDCRHVTRETVERVMSLFERTFLQ